ncbi:zinc ribbon domain-containing protein [Actinacidiphila sp. bgisy167]|uniref:zinc ribbon domain-containing protein n=1 Tax=Actinacidiphila sp. bgisy167 TaxID=3413797 RepID=UPI003D702EEB
MLFFPLGDRPHRVAGREGEGEGRQETGRRADRRAALRHAPGGSRGQFLAILANKAESAGRLTIPVDPRDTSRTCPPSLGGCGHVDGRSRVSQAKLQCTASGFTANADHVGATNISDRAGLALCAAASPPTQEARAFTRGWSHQALRVRPAPRGPPRIRLLVGPGRRPHARAAVPPAGRGPRAAPATSPPRPRPDGPGTTRRPGRRRAGRPVAEERAAGGGHRAERIPLGDGAQPSPVRGRALRPGAAHRVPSPCRLAGYPARKALRKRCCRCPGVD